MNYFRFIFLILCILFLLGSVDLLSAEKVSSVDFDSPKIIYYNIEDTIHGGTVEIIREIFNEAKLNQCEAILIQLDTPGGMLDATEDIVKIFLSAEIPVIVFVAPPGARAGSAGTFITLAAHVAVMAPGTYMGAAHPVMVFGGDKEGKQQEIMNKKIESSTSAYIETIAETRGRNKQWAKKAVLESESITQGNALKNHVIDLIAADERELLQKIDGRVVELVGGERKLNTKNYTLITYEPKTELLFLNFLASPTVLYLLALGFIAGIYLEATHPGAIVPGIIAAICFVMILFATKTLPINAFGILLILVALGLLITEFYVPSYGILTLSAIVCFFLGSIFFFDPQETDVRVPLSYILASSSALGLIALIVMTSLVRTYRRPQQTGLEMIVGLTGVADSEIHPGGVGKIFIEGEYWNACADAIVQRGQAVEVLRVEGLMAFVRPLDKI